MARVSKSFFCRSCGAESAKWLGKCPSCGEWNTFVEEIVTKSSEKSRTRISGTTPRPISEIEGSSENRLALPDPELNRVLGGGMVEGSMVLLGGEPGIGKSTLLLQVALNLQSKTVLYITGEESGQQIRMRGERVGMDKNNCLISTETSVQQIVQQVESVKPDLLIIDSVQTMFTEKIDGAPGTISQIRESTAEILAVSKTTGIPVFVVGHITKEGSIAGPKLLEHMVDVVLQFEGDRHHTFRIVRSLKNRYGSTNEIGIYRMVPNGLEAVENPSEVLISEFEGHLSGIAISATMEGIRPLLIEVQALVSSAVYGTPQRAATGFDYRRLNMLLAVLEKRCGFRLGMKDVFLNIAGGIKVDDPAIDLAVVSAILSSSEDIAIEGPCCFAGEIGLSGEIRPVSRIDQRIDEAAKLGIKRIFVSRYNKHDVNSSKKKIEIISVSRIDEVFTTLFG